MASPHSNTNLPHRIRYLVGATLERCIYCNGTAITKKGRRRKSSKPSSL